MEALVLSFSTAFASRLGLLQKPLLLGPLAVSLSYNNWILNEVFGSCCSCYYERQVLFRGWYILNLCNDQKTKVVGLFQESSVLNIQVKFSRTLSKCYTKTALFSVWTGFTLTSEWFWVTRHKWKRKDVMNMMKMGDIVWRTRHRHISGHSVVALWNSAVRVESLCCGCLGTVLQLILARGSIEMSIN